MYVVIAAVADCWCVDFVGVFVDFVGDYGLILSVFVCLTSLCCRIEILFLTVSQSTFIQSEKNQTCSTSFNMQTNSSL